jgi:hypothetical protein
LLLVGPRSAFVEPDTALQQIFLLPCQVVPGQRAVNIPVQFDIGSGRQRLEILNSGAATRSIQ